MADETEISTPVESVEDTSASVEPTSGVDTSTAEPETTEPTAETETQDDSEGQSAPEDTLYAGKYKTVDELVKGYNEAQKAVAKASEFEKKYNELLQQQQSEAEKIQLQRLREAQQRGFNTVEAQEIADKVQLAELEYFASNLNRVNPQDIETVRKYLQEYYSTGHEAYLNEAKKYFTSDFIEHVALEKMRYQNQLQQEVNQYFSQLEDTNAQKLAEIIKTDYAEFLTDIKENEGKAKALKSFCDVGSINSKEDMQVFSDIYAQIAKYEREQAIKEYQASKIIDETKKKAQIETQSTTLDSNIKPKSTDIEKMSQKQFDAYCDKYGMDWIWD